LEGEKGGGGSVGDLEEGTVRLGLTGPWGQRKEVMQVKRDSKGKREKRHNLK